jgi:hypothetical protein
MASGNTLCVFTPYNNEPPAAIYATLDVRNYHPVLDFDGATDEEAVFTSILPRNYAGGGLYRSARIRNTGSINFSRQGRARMRSMVNPARRWRSWDERGQWCGR